MASTVRPYEGDGLHGLSSSENSLHGIEGPVCPDRHLKPDDRPSGRCDDVPQRVERVMLPSADNPCVNSRADQRVRQASPSIRAILATPREPAIRITVFVVSTTQTGSDRDGSHSLARDTV